MYSQNKQASSVFYQSEPPLCCRLKHALQRAESAQRNKWKAMHGFLIKKSTEKHRIFFEFPFVSVIVFVLYPAGAQAQKSWHLPCGGSIVSTQVTDPQRAVWVA